VRGQKSNLRNFVRRKTLKFPSHLRLLSWEVDIVGVNSQVVMVTQSRGLSAPWVNYTASHSHYHFAKTQQRIIILNFKTFFLIEFMVCKIESQFDSEFENQNNNK